MAKQHSKKGFTLIETLVAITILITGIMVPMTIAARGLQSAFHAREQLTATFLAQEGMELVRLMRDNHALSDIQTPIAGKAPVSNIFSACTSGCALDTSLLPTSCSAETCRLYLDTTASEKVFYAHDKVVGAIWNQSPFTRSIQVNQVPTNPEQVMVVVTVKWQSGLFRAEKSVALTSMLAERYRNYYIPPYIPPT